MRYLAPFALLLVGCDPSGTVDPAAADAGDSGPQAEAGVDGSATDASADASADVSVGTPGYCESQWKGKPILVLGVTPSGGSSLYRVYPEGDWDEHVVDLVYNGKNISLMDLAHTGNTFYATNGAAYWAFSAPIPTGTHELGTPIPNANGVPPTTAYLTSAAPWIARGGTTFTQIDLGVSVDWQQKGSVFGTATSCTNLRDFLSGSGANPTYTFLATCGTDPNAVVTATSTKDVNNNWVGSSSIGTLPNSSAVQGDVLAVADSVYLTATKIYAAGVFKRNLKVCLNDGNLAAPIGGLRSAVQ